MKTTKIPTGEKSPFIPNPFPGKSAAVPQSGGKCKAPAGFKGGVLPGKV